MDKQYVVVTTDKRGVFAGFLAGDVRNNGDRRVTLEDARMAVYWSSDVRGVVGLAASGPTDGCRITEAAPSVELEGVTAVMDATDEARVAWEEAPWSI